MRAAAGAIRATRKNPAAKAEAADLSVDIVTGGRGTNGRGENAGVNC